jgi:LysR family hydrogen peroxide-inducible transcriptional activator
MVSAGIGVTLIPQMAVAVETRSALVSLDRFPAPEPRRRVGMVWRKANPLARELQTIAAEVRQASLLLREKSQALLPS